MKVVKIPTAPTAVNQGSMKDLQTADICDGRYAVDVYKLRSIKPSPRAIAECSIDREKFLRIGVSMGMQAARAMRSVLCGAYWGGCLSLPVATLPPKVPSNPPRTSL